MNPKAPKGYFKPFGPRPQSSIRVWMTLFAWFYTWLFGSATQVSIVQRPSCRLTTLADSTPRTSRHIVQDSHWTPQLKHQLKSQLATRTPTLLTDVITQVQV